MSAPLISIIIPCFNESQNVTPFYNQLTAVINGIESYEFELIYINDGSLDNTLAGLEGLAKKDSRIKVINLSRNFGKEIATSAGIHYAKGKATIMIDADGQHPPELITQFIKKWQEGAQVVIGVRKNNQKEGPVKRYGSRIFYKLFNKITGVGLTPGSTDFRLIDQVVKVEFIRMTERNRITRGLIDWLGFKHDYVEFNANARMAGAASYSTRKLVNLAITTFVSLSLKPLYFSVYAGLFVLPVSMLLLLLSMIEMFVGDPLDLRITGSAYMVLVALFLIGILLVSQGVIALYLSHIHTETQNRPLFVVDKTSSHGVISETVEEI